MKTNETPIRISDLLAMLLKAAKAILCCTLILGFLGAAYGAYSQRKATAAPTTAEAVQRAETAAESAELLFEQAQRALTRQNEVELPNAERDLVQAWSLVQQQLAYREKSLYYAMDPFHRGAARLTFFVQTDAEESPVLGEAPQASIVLAYAQAHAFDEETLEHVRDLLKVDADLPYIEELISVKDVEGRFVEIQVTCDDVKAAEQAVNYLYETLVARMKGVLADHDVRVVSTFAGVEVDQDMFNSRIENEDRFLTAQKSITSAEDRLAKLQKGVEDRKKAVEDTRAKAASARSALAEARQGLENAQASGGSVLKKAVKFGVAGLVAGLMIGCGVALFRGLFGGRVENQSEIMRRYEFPLIGVLPRTKKVWFDRAIRRLEGEPVGNFEATAQATAQSLLGRIGDRAVCLVSTDSRDIAEKLAAYTEDRVQVVGSILDDAASVKELADYEGVILVERRGKSRLDLVDAEVLRAKALGKEVLGIVLA